MQLSRPPLKSLLLVDDCQTYQFFVERGFDKLRTGTAIFPLSDGQSAIEHLALCGTARPMPDLVMLDRDLRDGPDGFAVLRAARALAHLSALPILMVSGSDDEEHILRATDEGAQGYLIKPPVQSDYPQLARQVLDWWVQKSWAQVGPGAVRSGLALRGGALQCSPMSAITLDQPAFLDPRDERSFGERFFDALGWMTRKAEEGVDGFQLALSRACRRHHLTVVQLMQPGGSQSLVRCRRETLVDLIGEGWPDETLRSLVSISDTEMKRLRAAARAKVGPKLDRVAS